jgi:hypothetical protein
MLAAGSEHCLVAVSIGAEPAPADALLAVIHDLDGRGPLMRVYADDDSRHRCSSPVPTTTSAGGHRYFELGSPLLSLSTPR